MPVYDSYLLKEDGGYLILEDGSGDLLLENAQLLVAANPVLLVFDETSPTAKTFDAPPAGVNA